MSDNSNKKNPIVTMMQAINAPREIAERTLAPMRERTEYFERISQAVIYPFGGSVKPAKSAPIVIDHETGSTQPMQMPSNTGKSKKELKNEIKDLKKENNELKNRLITVMEMAFGLSEKPATAIEYRPKSSNELQEKNDEIASLKAQLEQKEQENDKLQAKIDQLQATATPANDDIELTGTSKKAVTKLLYALLCEHKYTIDGTTTKGKTNQTLESLTITHNVGVSRETIASWLAEINTLYYNINK